MKRKINRSLLLIAALAILLTGASITAACYHLLYQCDVEDVILNALLPILLCTAAVVFLICAVLAGVIARELVTPMEQLSKDPDRAGAVPIYPELEPYVNTIRKQHEDILQHVRVRQDFTANVSHELKTPLTAISGYAELMENGMAQGEDVRRFSGEIRQNADRLLALINDTIRLSELDSPEAEVSMSRLNLYQLADRCVKTLQVSAGQHGVTLELNGGDCPIMANEEMMEELLYNLCDNAIRYTNRGGSVNVSVHRSGERGVLSVKDTGIGIAKDQQERIFERFYRVDKGRSKSTGGTGLGLAIVKHIVVQHNAVIEVESELGRGTEMKVVFPA